MHNYAMESHYYISDDRNSRNNPFSLLTRKRWKSIKNKILNLNLSGPYENVPRPIRSRIFGYNFHRRSSCFPAGRVEQIVYLSGENDRVILVTNSMIKLYDLTDFTLINEKMIPVENTNDRNARPLYNRLSYAAKMNVLIGWKPGGNTLFPLSCENFQNIGFPSATRNPLIGLFSNLDSGSVVSLELMSSASLSNDPSGIIFSRHWQFHFTDTKLVPDKYVPILMLQSCVPSKRSPEYTKEMSIQIISCPLLRKLLETYEFPSKLISFEEIVEIRIFVYYLVGSTQLGCDAYRMINISVLNITESIRILITGDVCGTIKTWNTDQVQLAIFQSHSGEISYFSTHRWDLVKPHKFHSISPSFVSVSRDGMIKCWQFWQSKCIYQNSNNTIKMPSVNNFKRSSMMEVDSRQALMNLYSNLLSQNTLSINQIHEVHDVLVKPHSGNIVLIGVRKVAETQTTQEEGHEEYYIEHWKLSEPCSPLAEFPQVVKHISLVELDDLYDVDTLEAHPADSYDIYQKQKSNGVAIIICDGKPGSIHLISTLNGSIMTTAVCEDSVEDAAWHWIMEKLYVLQKNGSIAVFSTCSRPCNLLCMWSSSVDNVLYSGPLLFYPAHSPEYLELFLNNEDCNSLLPQIILLLLVGQSDGSLAVICPKEGNVMSKSSTRPSDKTPGSISESKSKPLISSIKSNPKAGRLYTITQDGTLKVWQLIKPLPIIVQKHRLETIDNRKANLRPHFTHFPFKVVNNADIYCIYTAKDQLLSESCSNSSTLSTDECYYTSVCAEVNDPSDHYYFSVVKQCVI
ncbi:unnamed protein product [Heterobilharzia americana]|nr:unnamed protein product [Heterobilharzia americana]